MERKAENEFNPRYPWDSNLFTVGKRLEVNVCNFHSSKILWRGNNNYIISQLAARKDRGWADLSLTSNYTVRLSQRPNPRGLVTHLSRQYVALIRNDPRSWSPRHRLSLFRDCDHVSGFRNPETGVFGVGLDGRFDRC